MERKVNGGDAVIKVARPSMAAMVASVLRGGKYPLRHHFENRTGYQRSNRSLQCLVANRFGERQSFAKNTKDRHDTTRHAHSHRGISHRVLRGRLSDHGPRESKAQQTRGHSRNTKSERRKNYNSKYLADRLPTMPWARRLLRHVLSVKHVGRFHMNYWRSFAWSISIDVPTDAVCGSPTGVFATGNDEWAFGVKDATLRARKVAVLAQSFHLRFVSWLISYAPFPKTKNM